MKKNLMTILLTGAFLMSGMFANQYAAAKDQSLKSKEITYTVGTQNFQRAIFAWKEDGIANKPGILVVHEWWGFNDYIRMRTDMLADLGYVAMAVDMYGDGKVYEDAAALNSLRADLCQSESD